MSSASDRKINRAHVEGLRTSAPQLIQVTTQDLIRLHIDRIAIACVADLFAISEVGLPGALGTDLSSWAMRASREILDIPDGEARASFLSEVGEIAPALVSRSLREAVVALGPISQPDVAAMLEELAATWEGVEPETPKIPMPKKAAEKPAPRAGRTAADRVAERAVEKAAAATAKAKVAAEKAEKAAKAPKAPRAPKTPAAMVDPRRAEYIRADGLDRLRQREYAERGLKESILVGGTRHRSPFKDITEEEILAEFRKLEREKKVKHTGERWIIR